MVESLVERVLAPNPSLMTLTGTNTYVVGHEQVVVIDAGPDIPAHLEAILETAQRRGKIAALLVTHYHPDHLPAARTLQRRVDVPLIAHPSISGVDRGLEDDEVVRVDGLSFRALYTPGHTRDHHCFLLEDQGLLFTGDLILGQGTTVVGPPDGSLLEYMASLERLLPLPLQRIFPGHGPEVEQPREKVQEYLDHRRMRERQILQALSEGRTRIDEIVLQIYADVTPHLHRQAAGNVLSHLLKLEQEHRVERQGDRWVRSSEMRP